MFPRKGGSAADVDLRDEQRQVPDEERAGQIEHSLSHHPAEPELWGLPAL